MNFSEKLVTLRKTQKLSQEQLAEMLDVSRQSVSKWESQQTLPELGKILLLSNIFHVTTDELLRDDLSLPIVDESDSEQEPVELVSVSANTPDKAQDPIYCTMCGKPNRADSQFCGYCGHPFQAISTSETTSLTPAEMDLAYYHANLELEKQNLLEARKQTILQQKQLNQQKKEYNSMVKCPRCGSTSLSGNKQGYGIGKGVVGAAVFGPLGLIAGNINSKKVVVTCLNCGHKFKL